MPNDATPNTGPVADLPWLADAYQGICFTADIHPPGALHAAFVRAEHAHADIVDVRRGESDPDILAFWTAGDLPADIAPIPCIIPIVNRDGSNRADPPRTLMASDRCHHQGEILAMVVARTERAARRAAAQAIVSCRPLPAVTDAALALEPGAPQVRSEAPGNLCFDWELGEPSDRDRALRDAAHIVRRRFINNRVIVAPMETRNAIAAYVERTDALVLVSATQGVHWVRDIIARDVLGLDPARLEVITPRVGGSFGSKIFVYPEQVLTLLAARQLKATVKWSATRTEAFVSDIQGRDNDTEAAIALDENGHILAIVTDTLSNLGAHLSNYGPFCATTCGAPLLCGAYRVGTVYARVRGVFTHTVPVDSYRGAGRPEAHYVVERLIDEAAAELGLDPIALRLRNLIDETQLPYTTATGIRIDSGMFRANMRRALAEADYDGFARRREESAARGLLRGIGVANFLETNGGFALAKVMERETGGLPRESARITFLTDGRVTLEIGTQSSGQDHVRAYARILGDRLGLPENIIEVFQGRTDRLRQGTGTGGSKSMLSGSSAIMEAADSVIAKAKAWLADRTGRPVGDVDWTEGRLWIDGMALAIADVARMARVTLPGDHPFDTHLTSTIRHGTYGNGCHLCEVEVQPETGQIRVVRYTAVSDFGTIISMEDAISQQYGGIVQGLGQALFEASAYDEEGRQRNACFSRYHLPQAADIPPINQIFQGSACLTNPLGLKGCGEAGASAAPPAIMNALHDALRPGIRGIVQMPAVPQAVWEALQSLEQSQ